MGRSKSEETIKNSGYTKPIRGKPLRTPLSGRQNSWDYSVFSFHLPAVIFHPLLYPGFLLLCIWLGFRFFPDGWDLPQPYVFDQPVFNIGEISCLAQYNTTYCQAMRGWMLSSSSSKVLMYHEHRIKTKRVMLSRTTGNANWESGETTRNCYLNSRSSDLLTFTNPASFSWRDQHKSNIKRWSKETNSP